MGFKGVVNNTFLALGLPGGAPLYEFPSDAFVPGAELTPFAEGVEYIIDGLTKWEPAKVAKGKKKIQAITVTGEDYLDALTKMNNLFLNNQWGDSLPLLPPTMEKVEWIMKGTDLSHNEPIGKIMPSGRTATVGALAVNLAMTGGRPEHLPVLIAAFKAFCDERFRHHMMQATTCSVNIAGIVNGPIGKQIRLNSGYGCLGPDAAHPAGGCIGRAMRLVQQNVGGGASGNRDHGSLRWTVKVGERNIC